jgi:hypothetical protein
MSKIIGAQDTIADAQDEPDPVFAAIGEHKALTRESSRLEKSCRIAQDKAEKRYGKWERTPNPREWPGETTVTPFYVRCNRAGRAERKAAMRMARTKPTTLAGVAAMITHARREIKMGSEEDWEDWVPTALKTIADALGRKVAA